MSRICNFSADFIHIHSSDGFKGVQPFFYNCDSQCKQHGKASRVFAPFWCYL
ncbi:unnamed protein product [Musa acuminata subsp. malaccensis]|uniref:(wild Malaysian banana) hypothetical protein n=1 Tax=Musa acuminata subsp. malaccensis TaxID=214687 RepID=A0A804K377_MUSAM|nr:unnamed protein product [Musa acuminata subsp. malaccensis]